MKHILLYSMVLSVLTGCEPGFRIYAPNNSSFDLYIKTHPSLESLCGPHSSCLDSVISFKIRDEGSYGVYKVKPHAVLKLWGNIGGGPTVGDLPLDYIALISGSDTVVLDSKEKIIEQARKVNKKRDYYIEIDK